MPNERSDRLDDAEHAEAAGDIPRAIALLEELVRSSPNDARSRTWLAKLYGDREQFAAAFDMIERAIALEPKRGRGYAVLGELLLTQRRYEEATAAFHQALKFAKTSPTLVMLGVALGELGLSAAAQEAFEGALVVDSENVEAMYNLAIETRTTSPKRATELLESAVRIDPLYSEAYRELGIIYSVSGEYTRAEHALRTSLALDGSDPTTYVYLGNLMASAQNLPAAEAAFMEASELSPLYSPAQWGLAQVYEHEGRYAEAAALFRRAVELDSANPEPMFQLGRFLVGRGQLAEAKKWTERALAISPTHEEALALRRSLP